MMIARSYLMQDEQLWPENRYIQTWQKPWKSEHRTIPEALGAQITCPGAAHLIYCSNKCNHKSSLSLRRNKYPTYVKHYVYSKLRCSMELQTNKEEENNIMLLLAEDPRCRWFPAAHPSFPLHALLPNHLGAPIPQMHPNHDTCMHCCHCSRGNFH